MDVSSGNGGKRDSDGRVTGLCREKEGSLLRISSPHIGDIVGSTIELTYDWEKWTKGDHVHAFVDGQYQKGFVVTLHRLTLGKHQITVKMADHDQDLLETSNAIEIEGK